jgi:hypothetical protein
MITPFACSCLFNDFHFACSHFLFPCFTVVRFVGDIGGSLPVLEHVASQSGAWWGKGTKALQGNDLQGEAGGAGHGIRVGVFPKRERQKPGCSGKCQGMCGLGKEFRFGTASQNGALPSTTGTG